ncbi:RNA ligase/cyclic nucleotide phosphodiesterase [Legionella lansingensis]|uniref:RNA 2',3'-cyclic phosphodiesterase n=1 Tax=Legionella lansingensis TaxID=45067 RepID=A0A0W0VUS0_9GAMM|nr:RNA 2',3'-cyclic phosphodiesterase [Legionella lansingensis]KTD23774.1 RNA ligase/cyclic nucleotide phosphodiesterase [Legionella lansingensis]SNV47379.1 RNA ligase/cyclic nucleotide phosphodiesterase [Legionella lansingensis]
MTSRVFFAIGFPNNIRKKLEEILSILQCSLPQECIKWTSTQNLHITLAFLGNIQQEHIPRLIERSSYELQNSKAFSLQLYRLQLFPTAKKPRIISLEAGPDHVLSQIANHLRQAILDSNYSTETRSFRGHLTLGRLRNPHIAADALHEIKLPTIPTIPITEIHLFESKPGKDQSYYIPLARFPLK